MRTYPGLLTLPMIARSPGEDEADFADIAALAPAEEPAVEEEPAPEPEPEEDDAPAEEGEGDGELDAEEEGEPATEEPAEGEPEAEPPKTDWRQRQLLKERRLRQEAQEARIAAEAKAAALEALYAKPEAERAVEQESLTREEIRKQVEADVRKEDATRKLTQAADSLYDAGAKAYPKTWGARVAEAADALREEIVARPDFLEAVTELDNGAAVYHELAGDLDRMDALLKMPGHKMGMELAKISAKLAAKPAPAPVSKVPPPIKPLTKNSKADLSLDDPNISQEEFNRRMDAAEEKKYGKR